MEEPRYNGINLFVENIFCQRNSPPLFYSKKVPPKLIFYKGTQKDHVATFIFLLSFHDANSIKIGIAIPNKVTLNDE